MGVAQLVQHLQRWVDKTAMGRGTGVRVGESKALDRDVIHARSLRPLAPKKKRDIETFREPELVVRLDAFFSHMCTDGECTHTGLEKARLLPLRR